MPTPDIVGGLEHVLLAATALAALLRAGGPEAAARLPWLLLLIAVPLLPIVVPLLATNGGWWLRRLNIAFVATAATVVGRSLGGWRTRPGGTATRDVTLVLAVAFGSGVTSLAHALALGGLIVDHGRAALLQVMYVPPAFPRSTLDKPRLM
jgi:hypothetical protein